MLYLTYTQGLKDKRRSMDDIANDERVRKKPRASLDGHSHPPPAAGTSSDFSPFQYEGKNFSDFARGTYTMYVHSTS